ncbi:pre-mRNA-splicing factor ATP-dependent RNA helicase PRP43 [Aureobasidium sp. EXF-3400]|nr:pre-mRNA-splicing factor ATP-dependent RNA helicase PRP43 [Aureobasidium sp. EXF-3400]
MSNDINPHTGRPFSGSYYVHRERAQALPVVQQMDRLLAAIDSHQVTIVMGETGTGKSTQIPQYALERFSTFLDGKCIGLTQPRRLAAEEASDHSTIQSLIMAKAKGDSNLVDYGMIIIDEAHQHTTSTNLLLGLLKSLLTKRQDLKVVIISATMDANLFANYFPGSKVETVHGRGHEIQVQYLLQPPKDMIKEIVKTILWIAFSKQAKGHILVFVSGMREIAQVIEGVNAALTGPDARFDPAELDPLVCYPLHAKMSLEDQQRAVKSFPPRPMGRRFGRKVIVATNVAETSLTIEGVTHVVDSGMARSRIWNSAEETWAMLDYPISQAEIVQRIGRVGRQRDGWAWLMYTEKGRKEDRLEHAIAAIIECDMVSEALHIMKLGFKVADFPFIVKPSPEVVGKALGLLYQIGAINKKMQVTTRGSHIIALPIDVYSAAMLLEGSLRKCSDEVLSIVCMIEATRNGQSVWRHPGKDQEATKKLEKAQARFRHVSGEHLTFLNIYLGWRNARLDGRIDDFLDQWMLDGSVLRSVDSGRMALLLQLRKHPAWDLQDLDKKDPLYYATILQALAAGMHLQVAKRTGKTGEYEQVRTGVLAKLTKNTVFKVPAGGDEWVFYNECFVHPEKGKMLSVVSCIAPELLFSAQPEYWWDTEFLPEGHIEEGVVDVLSRMTGISKDEIRGSFPEPHTLRTA